MNHYASAPLGAPLLFLFIGIIVIWLCTRKKAPKLEDPTIDFMNGVDYEKSFKKFKDENKL